MPQRELPSGTVTFLFTDIEGSTRLLEILGSERYAKALAEHRRILREAIGTRGGVEVDTQGDAFFIAFPTAPDALEAAEQARAALEDGPIRVRMGIHTGTPHLTDEGYVGPDVHRAARIAAAGHGGQILVSAATAALVDRTPLRDLGEHRLKDLAAAERIYQLGTADFPRLKSLYQTNLPVPATPFVGRERELRDAIALLARDDVRLLTLSGPGGTGKTRLALQVAAEVANRYADGTFWVPLASLTDATLVLPTAAQVLGAKGDLADHIGSRSLLLLLDNFEHLMDAAVEVAALLSRCPNLCVMVTSRELLRLPAEQTYRVPPLEPSDAIELFVARGTAALPSFPMSPAVAELCARLENLPLALELAAARLRVLSPEQLIDRLGARLDLLKAGRGVDPRQQTLRATIEWSHELLTADEQKLFAGLAVFHGGCSLEAAEAVCHADLDTLGSLVDKSLVGLREDGRFWMLETIRDYAAERLDASGRVDEPRQLHARHYAALVETTVGHEEERAWLDALERDHGNLLAALDVLERTDVQANLRMAGALAAFWGTRGYFDEARRRLERALRADQEPTTYRAKALVAAADLTMDNNPGLARQWAEEARSLDETFADEAGVAESLSVLGAIAADQGDFARAHNDWLEALRRSRAAGHVRQSLLAARLLAWATAELGDRAGAIALHEENLRAARNAGDRYMEAMSLEGLVRGAIDERRFADAIRILSDAHALYREIGDVYRAAIIPVRLAEVLARADLAEPAARLLGCADQLLARIGAGRHGWVMSMREETLSLIRRSLDEHAIETARQTGIGMSADEATAFAAASLQEAGPAARPSDEPA